MKMRKHHCARLKHAKGQIFTCGMFGTCSDSVLSPRTPPPALVISSPLPTAAAAANLPPPPPPPAPAAAPPPKSNAAVPEKPKAAPLAEVLALPPSPDTVAQEKILSQWDFGLKQQMVQLRERESEMIKAAAAAAVAAAEPKSAAAGNKDDSSPQEAGFFKERYVGLVDRDLSPFQSSRTAPPAPAANPAPPAADQSLDSLTKDTACGRFAKASLRSLRVLAEESDRNKRAIIAAGVPDSLIALLLSSSPEIEKRDILREALALLAALADDEHTQDLIARSRLLPAIECDLRRRSTDAWILLCKLSANESAVDPAATSGILGACVALLKDPSAEAKLVRLALKSMLGICLSKPNRIPAVKAGAVEALLDTLVDLHGVDGGEFCSKSGIVVNVERALATLELLCTSSEGRAAICSQPNFISELVGLVLGVSERATEYAAGVLCAVLCDNLGSEDGTTAAAASFAAGAARITSSATFNGLGEHSSVQEMAVKGGAPAQMLLIPDLVSIDLSVHSRDIARLGIDKSNNRERMKFIIAPEDQRKGGRGEVHAALDGKECYQKYSRIKEGTNL
ncbi:hypothetical protein SELMODRAFT_439085 [Selaginella moellendorffii]|uniref:U-box domain-containing protein n=1 Tax=Selaginella moellendorffii TaxID=88036 RepID=D8R2B9_SELML|nr:hypothetical protein SELMODRAFT_439085 [Selaginella moellendorffii]